MQAPAHLLRRVWSACLNLTTQACLCVVLLGQISAHSSLQIENRQGLESFSEILAAADGIILSRGNLGLDVAAEKMAMVQKV